MPKKKANSQFPDVIYAVYEPDDDGNGYLVVSKDASDHAWTNAKIRIGIYRLEKVGDLVSEPTIVDVD